VANKRTQIVNEIVRLLQVNLDGTSPVITNVYDNVKARQIFWDEVSDYPTICVYPAGEIREYLPGDFKWAFLTVNIRIYVNDEQAKDRLEEIFDDIEYVLDNNNDLVVDGNDLSTDIRILSLSDDEGLLNPIGVGEITLEVRYEV
jgi:argonaute-like protein implicated in RNA metabolism and viral defense